MTLTPPTLEITSVDEQISINWDIHVATPFVEFSYNIPKHAAPTGLQVELAAQRTAKFKVENLDPTTPLRTFTSLRHRSILLIVGGVSLDLVPDQPLTVFKDLPSYDGLTDYQGASGINADTVLPASHYWAYDNSNAPLIAAMTGASGTFVLKFRVFYMDARDPTTLAAWANEDRINGLAIVRVLTG